MTLIKVHVANASDNYIWVRLAVDQVHEIYARKGGNVNVQTPVVGAGIGAEKEIEKTFIPAGGHGRTRISPGKYLLFTEIAKNKKAKLTIKRSTGRTVVHDYTVTTDVNFIVTNKDILQAKNTKTYWIDTTGIDHEPENVDSLIDEYDSQLTDI